MRQALALIQPPDGASYTCMRSCSTVHTSNFIVGFLE
jgi:hypothetical protein